MDERRSESELEWEKIVDEVRGRQIFSGPVPHPPVAPGFYFLVELALSGALLLSWAGWMIVADDHWPHLVVWVGLVGAAVFFGHFGFLAWVENKEKKYRERQIEYLGGMIREHLEQLADTGDIAESMRAAESLRRKLEAQEESQKPHD